MLKFGRFASLPLFMCPYPRVQATANWGQVIELFIRSRPKEPSHVVAQIQNATRRRSTTIKILLYCMFEIQPILVQTFATCM